MRYRGASVLLIRASLAPPPRSWGCGRFPSRFPQLPAATNPRCQGTGVLLSSGGIDGHSHSGRQRFTPARGGADPQRHLRAGFREAFASVPSGCNPQTNLRWRGKFASMVQKEAFPRAQSQRDGIGHLSRPRKRASTESPRRLLSPTHSPFLRLELAVTVLERLSKPGRRRRAGVDTDSQADRHRICRR